MFCKHCGKQIANDSNFCQYCGGRQDSVAEQKTEQQNVKVELGGQIKASIAPELPKFTGISNFFKNHLAIVLAYGIWLIFNILLLINGEDKNGFWPHTYSYSERVAEHTHLEYIPWSGETVETKSWEMGPETTKLDWDIDTYGWSEFLIYTILIPLLIFTIYRIFLYIKKRRNAPPKPIKYNYSEGLRRF